MTVNADQIAMWNGPAGERRASHPHRADAQVRRHYEHLRAAAAVGPADRVLDVGCGTGETTRDAARAAPAGRALGVDLSVSMLATARQLSAAEGVGNVSFELADAQVHAFEPERFDLAISRFGVMFFADPVAAFGNIARALRPAARLAMLAWQAREQNEWVLEIRRTLTGRPELPELPATVHPFSLADPAVPAELLGAAGFDRIHVTDVQEPVYYGADAVAASELVLSLPTAMDILAELDDTETGQALDRLRASLAAHQSADGVWFGARTWLITARRP